MTTNAANDNPKPCAVCGKPQNTRYRPFCSARCADIDLHRWLGGHYAIPAASDDSPEGIESSFPDGAPDDPSGPA